MITSDSDLPRSDSCRKRRRALSGFVAQLLLAAVATSIAVAWLCSHFCSLGAVHVGGDWNVEIAVTRGRLSICRYGHALPTMKVKPGWVVRTTAPEDDASLRRQLGLTHYFAGFGFRAVPLGRYYLDYSAVIPCWFVLSALVLPFLRPWYKTAIKARRRSQNRCEKCGYDLRSSSGRCPECGTAPSKLAALAGTPPAPTPPISPPGK